MPALSTKDKLKLRLSAEKVERWNRERMKPAVNHTVTASGKVKPVVRGEHLVLNLVDGKAVPKDAPIYPDKDTIVSSGDKMRLPCGKLTLVRRGDNFSDYHDPGYSDAPRDPAWKEGQAKLAKSRPDSPFKRAGKAAASVVIVRK